MHGHSQPLLFPAGDTGMQAEIAVARLISPQVMLINGDPDRTICC